MRDGNKLTVLPIQAVGTRLHQGHPLADFRLSKAFAIFLMILGSLEEFRPIGCCPNACKKRIEKFLLASVQTSDKNEIKIGSKTGIFTSASGSSCFMYGGSSGCEGFFMSGNRGISLNISDVRKQRDCPGNVRNVKIWGYCSLCNECGKANDVFK